MGKPIEDVIIEALNAREKFYTDMLETINRNRAPIEMYNWALKCKRDVNKALDYIQTNGVQ